MHISAETINKLARAVRSLEDAQLSDQHMLFAADQSMNLTPILINDDEEEDTLMTVGDLKEILRPFAVWLV